MIEKIKIARNKNEEIVRIVEEMKKAGVLYLLDHNFSVRIALVFSYYLEYKSFLQHRLFCYLSMFVLYLFIFFNFF